MSIATDAKVRELEKRIVDLETRIKILEGSRHEHADATKLGPKLGVRTRESRETSDI